MTFSKDGQSILPSALKGVTIATPVPRNLSRRDMIEFYILYLRLLNRIAIKFPLPRNPSYQTSLYVASLFPQAEFVLILLSHA